MKDEDRETLEKVLYDLANKIIGWVGNPSDIAMNDLGEKFIEFATYFTDPMKIIKEWETWITAYKLFAQYRFTGKMSDIGGMPKIYWRIKPEITLQEGKTILYARLLISNKTREQRAG